MFSKPALSHFKFIYFANFRAIDGKYLNHQVPWPLIMRN